MRQVVEIAKALGDATRMRALAALRGRELCLCQITELLRLAPSTVSKHMSILKRAGLVNSRKDGRWIYYCWAGREGLSEVKKALSWVRSCTEEDQELTDDLRRLEAVLKIDQEVLCRRQNRRCSKR